MSLREKMKENREKLKKKKMEDEDSLMNKFTKEKTFMKPDQETYDEFFAEADSLWKQQHLFKEGEPWSRNKEIMMFDVDTGDYTDEYKSQHDMFAVQHYGNTPRGFHYKNLIDDAAIRTIGQMENMDVHSSDLFKAIEGYFKDGALFHKESGEPASPYKLYNQINQMVEESVPGDRNDSFRHWDVKKEHKQWIADLPSIIPEVFTSEKPDTSKKK